MKHYKRILVLIFGILAMSCIASASEQQIRGARHDMSVSQVKALNKLISKACIKHGIPCELFTAVLIQESRLHVDAINLKTHDYGIGQINIKTIKRLNLDQSKLTSDTAYSIDAAALVLKYFYKHYKHETLWYGRYNAGTSHSLRTQKAINLYSLKVQQYIVLN
jgi:soluble lytic murein transglycosylase-like protein